jgi:TRAP transporter TAXI family solute receptor
MKRRTLKKSILVFFFLMFWTIFSMVWTNGSLAAAKEKLRLSLGASSTGTWFYMFCATMVPIWNKDVPEVDITAIATAGSNANYIPMDKGELDLAVGASIGNYWALHGLNFTKTKLYNFCTMVPISKNFTHAFTYADSPMKTFMDQEGKNLLVGAKASAAAVSAEEIFEVLGMRAKYIYATTAEAVDMMKDRRADGMLYNVAAPWSSILDIATARPLKLLSIPSEERNKIMKALPYNAPAIIPAKTYPFQNEDVQTMSTLYTINVRPGISEEIVYKLTKVAWEHWDELVKTVEAAKWGKQKSILDMIAPVHPGAAQYYKEIGIQIPDRLIWKKK